MTKLEAAQTTLMAALADTAEMTYKVLFSNGEVTETSYPRELIPDHVEWWANQGVRWIEITGPNLDGMSATEWLTRQYRPFGDPDKIDHARTECLYESGCSGCVIEPYVYL